MSPAGMRSVIGRSLLILIVTGFVGCGSDRAEKHVADQVQVGSSTEPPEQQTPAKPNESGVGDSPESLNPQSDSPEQLRRSLMSQATTYQKQGNLRAASDLLRRLLVKNPQDYEAIFQLANTEAAQGRFDEAIELLGEIPVDHAEAGIPSLGVSADWCFQTERYKDAEQRYRRILEMDPSINFARRRLAYLLNRQGRRHEAVTLIRQLCAAGDVMQDELHALIVESDAMYDPPGSRPAAGSRPYWPIGKMGQARYLFTEKQYLQAAEIVQPIIESGEAPASVIAFFGRAAVEAQDEEKLAWWRGHVNDSVKEFPEYWAAIGTYLMRETQYQPAVRALAEAIRLDPTDLRSIRRIFQGLRSMQRPEDAEIWIEHYALLNSILRKSNAIAGSETTSAASFQSLASDLESVGRKLEAILWRSINASRQPDAKQLLAELNQQLKQTVAKQDGFPNRQQLWCGMDLDDHPLPPFPAQIRSPSDEAIIASQNYKLPDKAASATFREISSQIGLVHTYRIARQPAKKGFAIYQAYGGGVAVSDFDLDGESDLYLAQGAADPVDFVAAESDLLYRTIVTSQSRRLVDITELAGVQEQDYTVGVTAGDWNQDGFPDLAVANIGINRLLINQGDGTFESHALDSAANLERFCTSLAMGDVSGDHLPDLFVLNYLRDPEITRLPKSDESGNVIDAVPPLSFKPSRDQLYVNNDEGKWQVLDVGTDRSDACTGLGIVVADLKDDQAGNEIFVGNDVMRNQFWIRDDDGNLVDSASLLGCAYGSLGSSTGAMGIAAADLDRTGTIDLHVSNYVNEPASLYINRDGVFRDLNVKFKLARDSTPMVGFGSQAIDYTNDGWLDLVVTNGHVEDLESKGQVFRQPIQLFANLGERFELVEVPDSPFWSKPHLGRALASLDFDRDGRMDFIVTDLLESTELLLNRSATKNHWVKIRLVGRSSERDAIGARVDLQAGNQSWAAWVTSGDGYLCKNESALHFGIGQETNIDRVLINWPSGQKQIFEDIPVDESILLVEDDPNAFVFSSPTPGTSSLSQ